MMKNLIATSLVAATLLVSGCGDSAGEKALSVQQKLDKGDFTGVISILQDSANTDSKKMQLGSAYMGAAGLSTTDLVRIMNETTSTTSSQSAPARASLRVSSNTNTTNASSFSKFAKILQQLADKNPKMLEYLSKATEVFGTISDRNTSKSVGFAIGLSNTAKATTSLSYLGDIEAMVAGGITGDLRASACAIEYMYAGSKNDKCSDYTIERTKGINNHEYDSLKVTVNDDNKTYVRLISGEPGISEANTTYSSSQYGEVFLNKNYTDAVTGKETNSSNNGLNFPIAVKIEGKPITIKKVLIDALNDGFDTIVKFAPADAKGDIEKYKKEIDSNSDGKIDASEITKFIIKESAK